MSKIDEKLKQIMKKYKIPEDKILEFSQDMGDVAGLLLKSNRPHLMDIDKVIAPIEYGEITVTLVKEKGRVKNTILHMDWSKQYTNHN